MGFHRQKLRSTFEAISFRYCLGLVMHTIYAADAARDGIARRFARRLARHNHHPFEPVAIPSGNRVLEARFVSAAAPQEASPPCAVLLFHGIGDRLGYWLQAQTYLAQHGVSSLIFHYSGCGQSSGTMTPEHLAEDAQSAYAWLHRSMGPGQPLFLLGFSLGTGLAAEVAAALDPAPTGLILCQAYTSLRLAAARVVAPIPVLARLVPDRWRTVEAVRTLPVPLLIVHSSGDRLFPVRMARAIFAAAQARAGVETELAIPSRHGHNAAYNHVPPEYWAPILAFIGRHSRRNAAPGR
jgi:alpha-beta hydrolase superfamily lysophospholipase